MATPPSLDDQIEELEREHAQRERIYPRWIGLKHPKLSSGVAALRQTRLRAAIDSLKQFKKFLDGSFSVKS